MPGPVICQSNVFSKADCAFVMNEASNSMIDINVFN